MNHEFIRKKFLEYTDLYGKNNKYINYKELFQKLNENGYFKDYINSIE